MAGWDRKINPLSKDYIATAKGECERTPTLETAVYHQVKTDRDQWVGDPVAGNLAYTIPRKSTEGHIARVADCYREALQVFVDAGQAAQLEVATSRDQVNRAVVTTRMLDIQAGEDPLELDLSALLAFGA